MARQRSGSFEASCMEWSLACNGAHHIDPHDRRQKTEGGKKDSAAPSLFCPSFVTARPTMSIRLRKLIGTVLLLLLFAIWALLAMALAQSVLTDINSRVAALYYVVAGLGWLPVAMLLIRWMSRPDR